MWMHECSSCAVAKTNGLHAWMRHLTQFHVIPTEWPSHRVNKLSGAAALRPYTMITESKKKRRKDTIPRPLNSFMLFAQHIRRNVLRVFSDASNSVISQQLGDLWRTVQQDYRNQYDEEANRLVKIHQLEFPTYKYQPKKRHLPAAVHHGGATGGNNKDAKNHSSNVKSGFDWKPRVTSINGTLVTLHTLNAHGDISDGSKSSPLEQTLLSSPQKSINAFKVTCTTPKVSGTAKLLSSTSSSTNINHTKQSLNVHSLSSVLPPLFTSSKQLQYSITDPFQFPSGSCDSGIHSSSSSSASSPVVGDLLSPNKLGSWNHLGGGGGASIGNSKSSPVRRVLQFVPIRPQSSNHPHIQVQPGSAQLPVRQRFFSANNGSLSTSNVDFCSTTLPNSDRSDLVNNAQPLTNAEIQYGLGPSSEQPQAQTLTPQVHQLTAPIYVRLNSDSSTNEDVILALPPGTTIIQSLGDLNCLPRTQTLVYDHQHHHHHQQQQQQTSAVQLLLQQQAKTSSQPLKLTKLHHNPINQPVISSTHHIQTTNLSNQCSPLAYSSSSCSSSAWSPLSTEVFFPTHQHAVSVNSCESDVICLSASPSQHPPSSPSVEAIHLSPQLISEPPGIDLQPFEMELDLSDQDDQQEQPEMHFLKINSDPIQPVCLKTDGLTVLNNDHRLNCYMKSEPLLGGNFAIQLDPIDVNEQTSVIVDQDSLTMVGSNGSAVGQCNVIDPPEYGEEDAIVEQDDDGFDCSLDAMMNSIDITTFLPGTLTVNDEQQLTDSFITDTAMDQCPTTTSPDIKCDMIDLRDKVNEVFSDPYFTSPANNDAMSPPSEFASDSTSPHLQHSPLADLDSLNKSSLFSVKPDWSSGSGLCSSC